MLLQASEVDIRKLAWMADVDRLNCVVHLRHGSHVEVREGFFIEGVWNGPFERGSFGNTDCVFGSGAMLSADTVRFVSSASTCDSLFYAVGGERVTVSNSLPLLLSAIGDRLDPHYLKYPEWCDSILDGINDYIREVPTQRGRIRRLMYRNLDVSANGVMETDKPYPPHFFSFKDYRNYLRDNYALIAANARDQARTHPIEIWSTQSKGYDSTAMNAIAARYGIDKVFTVTTSKSQTHLGYQDAEGPDDDGTEIAATLGLSCIPLARRAYTTDDTDEDLYYCALHNNEDMNLKGMNQHVNGVGLFLTGTLGELWYTRECLGKRAYLDADLRRWDSGGHGLSELRLSVGFIHLPFPYIGARRKTDIVTITDSPEMDPWRLKNGYDRPIPRRIAEEAGIPRRMFGQLKMGSVVIFPSPALPQGEAMHEQFLAYLVELGLLSRWQTKGWTLVRWINTQIRLRSWRVRPRWAHLNGALFCYCVNRTADELTVKIKGNVPGEIPPVP